MTGGLRHELLVHSGREEFLQQAVAFLHDGARHGEPGLLLADGATCAAARSALGADAAAVQFVDTSVVAHNPVRVLGVVRDAVVPGRTARAIAAPAFARSTLERDEILLHELTLSLPACRDWDLWLRCPYDIREFSAEDLAAVTAAHPVPDRVRAAATRAAELFATALADAPRDAYQLPPDTDLATARQSVRLWVSAAGLPDSRADDLVVAVNEAVTNSMRHGDGAVQIAVWRTRSAVVCEVRDEGSFGDLLAGRLAPPDGRTGGRGLWLVNHLCDLVQVRSPTSGTTVRMTVRASPEG